jgi:hypothetical protein
MKRRLDWPERLNDAIDEARSRPFADDWHCAAFATSAVAAMTDDGVPSYGLLSLADAYTTMRKRGHADVGAAVEDVLGPAIPLALARRGDVVLRLTPKDGLAVGICVGQLSAFVDMAGLVFLPTLEQHSAYRVP